MARRNKYNEEQMRAIRTKEPELVIIAPPGSGKTHTMAGAIDAYIENNPRHRVAAITFTRKATDELKHRLRHPNVQISTIHAWCLRELNKLGARYNFKVKLLEDREMHSILKTICLNRGLHTVNQFLLYIFVTGNRNIDISDGVKFQFLSIESSYTSHKRANNLYDFMDLPLYLYDMLVKYSENITTYDALFVDEFQDVDPIQEQIFRLTPASKKFFISDPDQAIYQFRGAMPEVIDKLIKEGGFASLRLRDNYRSYQEILDFATAFRDQKATSLLEVAVEDESWIHAVRGGGGSVLCIGLDGITNPITKEHQPFRNKVLCDILLERPYILCRSNKDVKNIQSTGYDRVSTIHVAKGLEYDDVVVVDWDIEGEEEVNIAYVACTRAKNNLTICHFNILMDALRSIPRFEDVNKLF